MRPNRRLHSEHFSSSTHMRLVLPAPGFDLVSICSSRGSRLVPARAAFLARRPPVLRRGSGHRRARGPSMRARPGDGAFSRRASPLRRLGRSSAGRCLPPRRSRRTAFWHPCRLLRFMGSDRTRSLLTSKAAEIASTHPLVKRGRAFPIRDAFLRRASRAPRTCVRAPRPASISRCSRDEDHRDPTLRLPFTAAELTSACAPCPRPRLDPRSRGPDSPVRAFDPGDVECALLWTRRRPDDFCNT